MADIRANLPRDLRSWRRPEGHEKSFEPCEALWKDLRGFFEAHGYTLWDYWVNSMLVAPDSDAFDPCSSGFMYISANRTWNDDGPGNLERILQYDYMNALTRAARARDGRDVVIRVLAIGEDGKEHVELLDMIARGPDSLLAINHSLPLLEIIELEDITFGIFPKAGWSLYLAYNFWAKSSVGDILHLFLQCLEALVYLHNIGVAHRDVFRDNFLAQWLPESLEMKFMPPSQPRVYINDFEVAVYFPPEVPEEERRCTGLPMGGSFPDHYGRPVPPEVESGKPYDPFKLDVWQLGTSFSDFKSTIPEVDAVLTSLTDPDPEARPTAHGAIMALLEVMSNIPPRALKIAPETKPLEFLTWSSSGSGQSIKEQEDTPEQENNLSS
ncbi:hypothetical protein L226DRAFT_573966 [Lentinus tigrinus ALCF2SS1-7]|uniref:Protein kinase domain-containing protein n=1 Tax=Lentinus tigrinus ALCF2SS1-6 TaxID=1328759 RepID=A0A5C2RZ54_9APHY|nr:hypothetical protein L227DRAFT_257313 [Lentinus tigrinus ALCF2SS1-6]RPD71496.1 hypothetical protein L226DRAFT_573966 [Lentinus tigrinus ALCF2SS1-7]